MSSDSESQPASSLQPLSSIGLAKDDPASPGNRIGALLQSYFRSGWAFFIPYLAAYLLYAWLRWPVNPHTGDSPPSTVLRPPSLLHLYWALHAIHLVLGIIALRSWWKATTLPLQLATSTGASSALLSTADRLLSTGYSLLPWLFLAFTFWLPGIYLEWPSDPWEHLRRINEWRVLDEVTTHSAWRKSSYFLPYSLTEHTSGPMQLIWLNVYYTGVCLLLAWQYYRLALAAGLSERASFIFVLLNALIFGNSSFSFYRYYGLSSSMFAQIGAVAVVRVALQIGDRAAEGAKQRLVVVFISVATLVPFITSNHLQGLGSAVLGVGAIVLHRLVRGALRIFAVLGGTVVVCVAMTWWYPRSAAIDAELMAQGWLSPWYGFNVLWPGSPAAGQLVQILAGFGLLNALAGFALFRRNPVVAWLTTFPLVALCLPAVGIPFANALLGHGGPAAIGAFHRMYFAIPAGLALACWITSWFSSYMAPNRPRDLPAWMGLAFVAMLVLLPARGTLHNRLWNFLAVTPRDLQLWHVVATADETAPLNLDVEQSVIVTTDAGTNVLHAMGFSISSATFRRIGMPMSEYTQSAISAIERRARSTGRSPSPAREPLADLSRANSVWISMAGASAISNYDYFTGRGWTRVLGNPAGEVSYPFVCFLVPIDPLCRYQLKMLARRIGAPGTAYLAVAWYDERGRLLESSVSSPKGAGNPAGWTNGAYSYFGLVGSTPPAQWTEYEVSFGFGEPAQVPAKARFLRVGALLNFHATPAAEIQIADVELWQKSDFTTYRVLAPAVNALFSPGSQAALVSRHWMPHQVMLDHAGTAELLRPARHATK